ncbi:MAG TPA: GGDEF domain-containing protein [Terriglobales bacterium]|nr:GGDEF domain-containing protein [Terriglobales bacterium]
MATGGPLQIGETQTAVPSTLERAEHIRREIEQLSGRDLQLWSIGILVMLVLAAGMLALVFPNLIWAEHSIHIQTAYLPQLFFGLISLILLFNIYLLQQKISLNHTRGRLIGELVRNERLESLSLVDPLTQLLNRRALNELIPREVARANRLGRPLTFMAMDLKGFREINAKFGRNEGNQLLTEFSKLLKNTFRGCDAILRQGGDEFMVVLPDTSEEDAEAPLDRLGHSVRQWNASHSKGYELSFAWAVAPYVPGGDIADVLRALDRKIYQKQHNLIPVF